jgi:hypothetical protein
MTYDDEKEQAETKKTLDKFMDDLCGPFVKMFRPFAIVYVHKENLDEVINFKGYMQQVIIKRTKEDTALRREGTKLMNELEEIIVKCRGLLTETAPEKQKTDASLSNLLAQLTQMGDCST